MVLENIGHIANILILGDFNVDLSKVNFMSNDFKHMLHAMNLTNIIEKHTRITDKSCTQKYKQPLQNSQKKLEQRPDIPDGKNIRKQISPLSTKHMNLNLNSYTAWLQPLITKSLRAAVKNGKACGEDNLTSKVSS